jgi:hypothetical protein
MMPLRRTATDGPLYEYARHEGNVWMHGIIPRIEDVTDVAYPADSGPDPCGERNDEPHISPRITATSGTRVE